MGESIQHELRDLMPPENFPELIDTSLACLDVLARDSGGIIIVVLHKTIEVHLRWHHLDGGALREVFAQELPNIFEVSHDSNSRKVSPKLDQILQAFCAHSATDRWGEKELRTLEDYLGKKHGEDPKLQALMGQPMDGAMVVDYKGNVLNAAVKLSHSQERWLLQKHDGTAAGTRHSGALSTAVWLSNQRMPGIVFVRSDSGGVHCFFGGQGSEAPRALYLNPEGRTSG